MCTATINFHINLRHFVPAVALTIVTFYHNFSPALIAQWHPTKIIEELASAKDYYLSFCIQSSLPTFYF